MVFTSEVRQWQNFSMLELNYNLYIVEINIYNIYIICILHIYDVLKVLTNSYIESIT